MWTADPTASPNGQYAYYVNGTLVGNLTACAHKACDMGMPVQGGGIIHMGQEADKPWGDFEELQAFTGVVDDLRVWTTVRTDAEIRDSYLGGLTGNTSSLDFWWQFDNAGAVSTDSSGNGRDGTVGNMATTENQMQYSTGRAPQSPATPLQVPSTAPAIEVGVPSVFLTVAGANEIVLRSADADGDDLVTNITSLPTAGTITDATGNALSLHSLVADGSKTQDKRVIYTATDYATFTTDTFTYTVSDGGAPVTATIKLDKYTLPAAAAKTYTFKEDVLSSMVLGKAYVSATRKYSTNLNVLIESLPARGTLYQACFTADSSNLYTDMCAAGTSTPMTPITTVPTTLTNPRGILMFQPAANEYSTAYATFTYKYVDPDDATISSSGATVSIGISAVNDAPTGSPQQAIVAQAETHIFTLTSADNDEDSTNNMTYAPSFGPHPFARISTFPKAGKLQQVEGTTATTMFDSTVTSVPIVSSWTSEVVRFSSQFSKCNAGKCFIWSGAEDTGCNQANKIYP